MSYSTRLYAVDLDALNDVLRNKDTSVLTGIRQKNSEQFDRSLQEDGPTLGVAAEQIIKGQAADSKVGYLYGYGLELMCSTLGEMLPDDDMLGDLGPLELDSPLLNIKAPVELPKIRDFPFISFLTATEVQRESQRVSSLDLSFPDDPDIEEAREAYGNCVRIAAEQGRGIVSFYS